MSTTCSNCYSGCVEIQSDKCVKYTGVDIDVLGVKNGDSMNYVTAAIAGFLTSTLDGSGIKYELDPSDMCTLVSDELADCTDITVVDITAALSNAICQLDALVAVNISDISAINATYTPDCVPGIDGTEGAHTVLQAVIDQLCTVTTDLDALELDVSTNYVLISDIDTYISNYLIAQGGGGTALKDRMIPHSVVEYYGSLTFFDVTGAGTGDWAEIFLCNGNNGTPDKRGRVPVGTTSGMGGGDFPNATDPLVSGNPTYQLYTTTGANTIVLTDQEIPSHSHTTTAINTVTPADHTHFTATTNTTGTVDPLNSSTTILQVFSTGGNFGYALRGATAISSIGLTSPTTITVDSAITNNATGGGASHSNIQPVLACHYIIYIPAT